MSQNIRYGRCVLLLSLLIGCTNAVPNPPNDANSPHETVATDTEIDSNPIKDTNEIHQPNDTDDGFTTEVNDSWIDTNIPDTQTPDVPDIADSAEDIPLETADTTTSDTVPSDAAEICEPLLAETTTEAVPIVLGSAGAGGAYNPSMPGDPIEIVQGPQGGVHVEVAFEITLPEVFAKSSAKMKLSAHSFQPCCMGNMVGSYTNNKFLAFKKDPAKQIFVSGVVPVIFFQNEAIHYQDAECCVVLSAEVFGPQSNDIIASGSVMQSFHCVDYF